MSRGGCRSSVHRGCLSYGMGASRLDPWGLAVEIRGCQSLLRSSHIRSVGASRYCVAPSAPTVIEIPSSRRVDPWVPAVESRGCQSLLRSSLDTHGYRDAVFQTGMEWLFFIFTYKVIYGAFIMK
jgi:hypothetical protein